jgi:outer membrane protein
VFALPRIRIGRRQRHRAGFRVVAAAGLALVGLTPCPVWADAIRPTDQPSNAASAVAPNRGSDPAGPAALAQAWLPAAGLVRGGSVPAANTARSPLRPRASGSSSGQLAPAESLVSGSGSEAAGGLVGQSGGAPLTLEQVLERGVAVSLELNRGQRQLARDRALIAVNAASMRPQLGLIGMGSYTEVGTSVGFLSNLPTLGDLSLSLGQNGYAVLQNTFGNVGLVLDVNLLPLRQRAELAASRAELEASSASQRETQRQVRFNLVSTYRQLQLQQALVPIWQQALLASGALERDAETIRRRGLAPRIDVLRSRALRANDEQGLALARGQVLNLRQQLAALLDLPPERAPSAADPLAQQPPWPLDLPTSLERGLRDRPLLQALEAQQKAQRQQAAAARALMGPSLSLLVGGGYSGDNLAVPVLNQSASLNGPLAGVGLTAQQPNGSVSGSFYNWGAALMLRQPLYDGGRSSSAVALADRQRELLQSDEDLARRRIREDISTAWAALQTAPATIEAARMAVQAGERAVRDAQLRYRAQVETITEVLLVQRELQAAHAALVTALTRQALDRAILQRETEAAPTPARAQAQPENPAPMTGDGAPRSRVETPAAPATAENQPVQAPRLDGAGAAGLSEASGPVPPGGQPPVRPWNRGN